MFLDIFEDYIYFSTYSTNNIKKMIKFGNESESTLIQSLPHSPDLIVAHRVRQRKRCMYIEI